MAKIKVYYPLTGLRIDPDNFEHLEIDEKAIQSLASLFGWDGLARRMITCSSRGSLNAVSPAVVGIENIVSSTSTEDVTFSDELISEVMIVADSTNFFGIWVNVFTPAGIDTGWPLLPGDSVKFSINNMSDLHLHIIRISDQAIIMKAG